MIPVSRIVTALRYSLRDMHGANVSDFEIINAINQAASLLYGRLSENYVHNAVKKIILVVDDTLQTSLPSDFISVYRVGIGEKRYAVPVSYKANKKGTYRITGDNFYAPEGTYTLEYFYLPARVNNLTDSLDVSPSVSPYIEQIAAAILGKDLTSAEQVTQTCCRTLSGGEISHFENAGPVQILGGRL